MKPPPNRGTPGDARSRKGKEEWSPRIFSVKAVLLTPWFHTFGIQNDERINFCLKPQSLWSFGTAVLGNEGRVMRHEFLFSGAPEGLIEGGFMTLHTHPVDHLLGSTVSAKYCLCKWYLPMTEDLTSRQVQMEQPLFNFVISSLRLG